MTPALPAATRDAAALMERVLLTGDLAKLTPQDRLRYYMEVCDSLGLNWRTRPFEYLVLNGRMLLYARKDATDQLRALRAISVTILARERVDDLYVVTARATTPDGRTDEAIGAISLMGLKGEALANALMKCESKAKRRVTLSICGLGMSDETEVDAIPGAKVIRHELPAAPVTPAAPPPAGAEEPVALDGATDLGPADPEPTTEEPEVDPQALLDTFRERLQATESLDGLKALWEETIKPALPKLSPKDRADLVLAKDLAKERLGAEMPPAWRGNARRRR